MAAYPDKFERALRGALNDISALLLREAQTYPEQRSGGGYVRTMTLNRSWNRTPVEGTGDRLWAEVGSDGNIAPYNRNVMDADTQAAVHVGTWRTIQAIVQDNTSRAVSMFEARVRAEL
jgi:hypothetical protein